MCLNKIWFYFILFFSFQNGAFCEDQNDFDLTSSNAEYVSLTSLYGEKNVLRSTVCGGFLESMAGVIDYKMGVNLSITGEVCVWTILVPQKNTIQVQLIGDGFSRGCINCQIITIHKMKNGLYRNELVPEVTITRHPNRNVYNVTGGSLIQISFSSPPYPESQGFLLVFHGIGDDNNGTGPSNPVYKVYEPQGLLEGELSYQAKPEPNRYIYDFVTFTLHPENGKRIALTLERLYGYSVYPSGCSHPSETFVVNEFSWDDGVGPLRTFATCFLPATTTIYSLTPLRVSYYTSTQYRAYFKLNWKMN